MVSRRGIALRWRIAIFSSLAIAFLSLLASVAAYVVVRSSLVGDLQRSLGADAARMDPLVGVLWGALALGLVVLDRGAWRAAPAAAVAERPREAVTR